MGRSRKKIGLLTMPLGVNYGGIIQLVALQSFLQNEGFEATLLNRRYSEPLWIRFLKKILENIPLLDIKGLASRKYLNSNIELFKYEYIKKTTRPLFTTNELINVTREHQFDAIIVGSDQVWNIEFMRSIWRNAFLNFASSKVIKKIAYAASFGSDEWKFKTLNTAISNYLHDFHAISVREDSAVKICERQFNFNSAVHVVDPTLLVETNFYQPFLLSYNNSQKEGVFSYFLDFDKSKEHLVEFVGTSMGLPNNISELTNYGIKKKKEKKPGVEAWLSAFANAAYVITDSYHGTIFAIIFNKPFLVLNNRKRGSSRFESLLKHLGLEERLIEEGSLPELSLLKKSIDYVEVMKIIEEWRTMSRSFLLNALEE